MGFGEVDVGGLAPGDGLVAGAPDLVVGDPAIPAVALRISVDPEGCRVAPFDGADVRLDGRRLASVAPWAPGQQVTVGGTLLDLVPFQPPDAALHPAEDGAGLEFNRPPRLLPRGHAARFSLPGPPSRPERRPVPVLVAVVPVVLGVAMAYLLHQVYMLAMAAFSPVMLLGSYLSDRRGGRRSYARQLAGYREHRARVERDAAEAWAERLRRRHDCPDPATVASIATGPRRRLWERCCSDPDYLLLGVGTSGLPSAVELTDPAADEHRRSRFDRPQATFHRMSYFSASAACGSDRSYSSLSTSTDPTRSAGSDGRPVRDGNKSAVNESGNSSVRCAARNARRW